MGSHSLLSLALLSVVCFAACVNGAQIPWNNPLLAGWIAAHMHFIDTQCHCQLNNPQYKYVTLSSELVYIVQRADNQVINCQVHTGNVCSRIGENARTCVFSQFPNNFYCV